MTDPRSNVFDMWPARGAIPFRDDALGDGSDFGVNGEWWGRNAPNLYDSLEERARIAASAAISRNEARKLRLRQAAEIVVMLAVAVFIGFALAVQL